MYEQEYGQKTELSMADMIKRRIISESKDVTENSEKAAEIRIYHDMIVKNLEKADNLMQSNCTAICLSDF